MLIYTELFGLREVDKLPKFIPVGTYKKEDYDMYWVILIEVPKRKKDQNTWRKVNKDDLPNKLKLSLLILDQHN